MGRPRTIDSSRILDIARSLFADEGFGVTTARIARAAGVSEGLLFKRFVTKRALFDAAMSPPALTWLTRLTPPGDGETLHDRLVDASLGAVAFFREMLPRIMSARQCPQHERLLESWRDGAGGTPPPVLVLSRVSEFLASQRDAGVLRRDLDADTAARLFVGAIHNYVFFEVMGFRPAGGHGDRAFAGAMVASLLDGIVRREPVAAGGPTSERTSGRS